MQFFFGKDENAFVASQAVPATATGSPSSFFAPVLGLEPGIYRPQALRDALKINDLIAQKLFSAALIADVLPRLMEINPSEGRIRLGELRQLTQGAMIEMQNLLEELQCTENRLTLMMEGKYAQGGGGSE